jgi:hypothetical protein
MLLDQSICASVLAGKENYLEACCKMRTQGSEDVAPVVDRLPQVVECWSSSNPCTKRQTGLEETRDLLGMIF